jgi:hypothetical protein
MYTRLFYLFILFYFVGFKIDAQITFTKGFTKLLKDSELEYFAPVEDWYHIMPDEFLKYDLVIQNQDGDVEIRFVIKPYKEKVIDQYPHIEYIRMLLSIATNNETEVIRQLSMDKTEASKNYNADWAGLSHFVPKRKFSKMRYGCLISFYKENIARVYTVILYDREDLIPFTFFKQLKFKN